MQPFCMLEKVKRDVYQPGRLNVCLMLLLVCFMAAGMRI